MAACTPIKNTIPAKHDKPSGGTSVDTSGKREILIVQSKSQIDEFSKNTWTLQFAQGVKTADGKTNYNLVWDSKPLQHHNHVIWTKPVYALNWTADYPAHGSTVCVGGMWQEVEIGSVWDLAEDGYWTTSDSVETSGYIGVGEINYHCDGVPGIHVVIGMKCGKSSSFSPIFVDPTALELGSSSIYQPKEEVVWWYDTPKPIGAEVEVGIHVYGIFIDGSYICSTYDGKKWDDISKPPAAEEEPEPQASASTNEAKFPFTKRIIFTPAIKSNLQENVAKYLKKKLSGEYTEVDATFSVENKVEFLQVILEGRKNAKKRKVPVPVRSVVADISASIRGAEGANFIPKKDNEVWRFISGWW
ncbi:hypothetical protein BDD12DRAFT_805293 [Trichophaea hybrida]|nr:hypothetical protein BDD12DRAFT_805293 [Trichophaea hybrida]